MKLMTLCYIQNDDKTLMLHRIKKENDLHEGKWNGVGGKFEKGESPEDCVIREVKEETGLNIKNPKLKGIITFPEFSKNNEDFYVFVFTANEFNGNLIEDCPEGHLEWIKTDKILDLNLWDGDKYFIPLLNKPDVFSAKLIYKKGIVIEKEISIY